MATKATRPTRGGPARPEGYSGDARHCGKAWPIIEWRPHHYGAECGTCGKRVAAEEAADVARGMEGGR